jgi:ribonucleoside-diphosphate reductase subunit M2
LANEGTQLIGSLVALVVEEGVLFSSAFCSVFWFKKRNMLHGLSFSNELIARDERLHTETNVLAYSFIDKST